MKRSGDESDQPPGGHAAERLREQFRDRFGADPDVLPAGLPPTTDDAERTSENDAADSGQGSQQGSPS